MKKIKQIIDVDLIFETYKIKVNEPHLTFTHFCIYVLGSTVTIVNGWKKGDKQMTDYKKSKVLKFIGLDPEQYCKNVIMGWSNPEENQDLDNRCMYCKEKCQNHYCSRKCEEADIND
jgi:hypothetical protein